MRLSGSWNQYYLHKYRNENKIIKGDVLCEYKMCYVNAMKE